MLDRARTKKINSVHVEIEGCIVLPDAFNSKISTLNGIEYVDLIKE